MKAALSSGAWALLLAIGALACGPLATPAVEPSPSGPAATPRPLELPTLLTRMERPSPRFSVDVGVPIAVAGNRVYVLDITRKDQLFLRAVAIDSGAVAWSTPLDPHPWPDRDHAVVVGDRLLLVNAYENVRGFSTVDGHQVFDHPLEHTGHATTVTADAVILCVDGKIEVIAVADGRTRWTAPCRKVAGNGEIVIATQPADAGGFPWDDRLDPVVGLDARTGRTLWTSTILGRKIRAFDGVVLVEEKDALAALDLATGALRFRLPGQAIGQARLAGGRLFLASGSTISALDARTGATQWSVDVGSTPLFQSEDTIFAAGDRSVIWSDSVSEQRAERIVRLDAATGRLTQVLALHASSERMWLVEDELVIARGRGVARLARDQVLPALDSLRDPAQIDALLDEPLGDLETLATEIGAVLRQSRRELFTPQLVARIARLPDERLPILLPPLGEHHVLGTVDALVARFPGVRDREARRLFVNVFEQLADARATAMLGQALADPLLAQAASEALVHLGTHDALARVAAHLDARIAAPVYLIPCLEPWKHPCPASGVDRDGDGWADALEAAVGTAPDRADSDGDGLDDARDPCPLLAGGTPEGDAGARLQAAFLAVFASDAPTVIHLVAAMPKICLRGAKAPVVHRRTAWKDGDPRPLGAMVSLTVVDDGPSPPVDGQRSDVSIGVVHGPLSGMGHVAHLVFREGRWFCEKLEGTWGS